MRIMDWEVLWIGALWIADLKSPEITNRQSVNLHNILFNPHSTIRNPKLTVNRRIPFIQECW